jgi:hypothetical protein
MKIPTHDAGSMKVASRSDKITPLPWPASTMSYGGRSAAASTA